MTTGVLAPARAYSGFANGTILLIVVAFLVARAVVKCGLGERLGHLVVSLFGRSTLGLGYSIFLVDGVIAGERVVVQGAFTLKSELAKSELGEGHAH